MTARAVDPVLQVEESVIGECLAGGLDAYQRAATTGLQAEHFAGRVAGAAWDALAAVAADPGGALDVLTVARAMRGAGTDGYAAARGGAEVYLAELANMVPTADGVGHHARMVVEAAARRQLAAAAEDLVRRAAVAPLADIAADLQRLALDAAAASGTNRRFDVRALMRDHTRRLAAAFNRRGALAGLGTPWPMVDEGTLGLQWGEMILLTAPSGKGKSAAALQIAVHGALVHGCRFVYLSAEMAPGQIADRAVCQVGGVDGMRLRAGQLASDDWRHASSAVATLTHGPQDWQVVDAAGLTVEELIVESRAAWQQMGKPERFLVVLDYAQLVRPTKHLLKATGQIQLAHVSRELRLLAARTGWIVLLVAQENRAGQTRGAADLENDASLWLALEPDANNERGAILRCRKHRAGPLFFVRLDFRGAHFRFLQAADQSAPSDGETKKERAKFRNVRNERTVQ